MPIRKKQRRTEIPKAEVLGGGSDNDNNDEVPQVAVEFLDENGKKHGPKMLIPVNITSKQLDELLCSTFEDEEDKTVPYAFFLQASQITQSLQETLHAQQKVKWIDEQLAEGRRVRKADEEKLAFVVPEEDVLGIVYRPQAVFRVRPVTRCATSLDGHSEAVLIVHFSPDGKCLATGSGDKTVRIWDVLTSTPVAVLENAHANWVQALAWSPDARFLASGSRDGALCVWRHQDYTDFKAEKYKAHTNFLSHIAWEPLHATPTGECARFVTASKDAALKVWKVGAGNQFSLSGHTAGVTCVKWGGAGVIYSSSQDKLIIVWSADNGAQLFQLRGHAHWVNFIALNADHCLRTGTFDHEDRTFSSTKEAKEYAQKRYDAVAARVGTVPTERVLSCSDDNTMFLWAPLLDAKKPLARLHGHQGIVFHGAFSPDGSMIASCSNDKSVRVWSAVDGKFIYCFRGHVAAVYHVSWSLDSRMLVSGSRDTTLKLWSIEGKKLVEDLSGHSDEIFSTDWSPDGQRVATGSKDKKVRIWVN